MDISRLQGIKTTEEPVRLQFPGELPRGLPGHLRRGLAPGLAGGQPPGLALHQQGVLARAGPPRHGAPRRGPRHLRQAQPPRGEAQAGAGRGTGDTVSSYLLDIRYCKVDI